MFILANNNIMRILPTNVTCEARFYRDVDGELMYVVYTCLLYTSDAADDDRIG